MRTPGEVYFLPADRRADGDAKARRHVLLADCDDGSVMATVAFASTRYTEAAFGAQYVLVNPAASHYRSTGFNYPTYVYPSRIISVNPEDLGDFEGKVLDEMVQIRKALGKALGIGTGTSNGGGEASGSWRGRIIRLAPAIAQELDADLAVIITEPGYSMEERYQTIVPIVSAVKYEPGGLDVLIQDTTTEWLKEVNPDLRSAFLWTEAVFAVFQPDEIVAASELCLDDGTLRELENALEIYFKI